MQLSYLRDRIIAESALHIQDELFGEFLGVWEQSTRTLSYWGDPHTKFDVTTIADAADSTAEALYRGAVGDLRVATATISAGEIAKHCSQPWCPVQLKCRGSLDELQQLLVRSSGLEQIRLQCQRCMFAGEAGVSDAGSAGFLKFLEHSSIPLKPAPWTSPTCESHHSYDHLT